MDHLPGWNTPEWNRGWAIRLSASAHRMALAVLDDEPGTANTYADMIIDKTYPGVVNTIDDDPTRLPLSATIKTLDDWITLLVRAAELGTGMRMADHVDMHQLVTEIEAALPRFVPEKLRSETVEALQDAERDKSPSTFGNLWATAFLVAWLMRHPWIAANPVGARAELVKRIKKTEALVEGDLSDIKVDVTEAEAIARLEAVLVPSEEQLAGVSDPVMREKLRHAPIDPDPARRTLWQLDVLETAKAHVLEYPTADELSNRLLFDAVAAVMADNHGRNAREHMIANVRAGRSSQAAKARNAHKPKKKKRR